MNSKIVIIIVLLIGVLYNDKLATTLDVKVYQTSASGDHLKLKVDDSPDNLVKADTIQLFPAQKFQTITGFGGAFTESSAYLLNQLSPSKRKDILEAYFSESGANYSLTRTHMNSCDFSIDHYSYAEIEDDTVLKHFSIDPDRDDIIPMIKEAQDISPDGFKIVASPWTAPPWMKDNNAWNGGKLIPAFYPSWALFFSKYIKAYAKEGIDIWGLTVENEPLGNDENWESMHFTPKEMANFIKKHLGPQLKKENLKQHLLVYDQNRGHELKEWSRILLNDKELSPYIYGTAVHWYNSTFDWMPSSLNYTHRLAPKKHILNTEACVDAEIPKWKDDQWYWSKEATDWGWDWAPEEDKHMHPKYVPVYRYARDIIGCLNSWVEGWIDWNMVLDKQGGPNLAKNWCIAPIIVDPEKDEVYYTPLFYTMAHFSKFIRPGAIRIGHSGSNSKQLMLTAAINTDGNITLIVLNMDEKTKNLLLQMEGKEKLIEVSGSALQTIIINSSN